jgi:hypothetical protein
MCKEKESKITIPHPIYGPTAKVDKTREEKKTSKLKFKITKP